jgi:hypothetical protein
MKRLNPLYIISLFITILVISVFLLNEEKSILKEKTEKLNEIQLKAKEYKSLKNSWNNEKYANDTLDLILKNKIFSNQKILKASTNELIKLKIESDDPKILDSFLNKILNKELAIKKLEVEKRYINLEIGIK